ALATGCGVIRKAEIIDLMFRVGEAKAFHNGPPHKRLPVAADGIPVCLALLPSRSRGGVGDHDILFRYGEQPPFLEGGDKKMGDFEAVCRGNQTVYRKFFGGT